MNHYVPIDKQSKKKQREFYALRRNSWNEINPITKKIPSKKIYNRNKMKIVTEN